MSSCMLTFSVEAKNAVQLHGGWNLRWQTDVGIFGYLQNLCKSAVLLYTVFDECSEIESRHSLKFHLLKSLCTIIVRLSNEVLHDFKIS